MVITNRNLEPGTRLVAKYKGQTYTAIVLPDGKYGLPKDQVAPSFSAADMESFKSPSAAGSAIMGGIACNGWRFWSVEGEAAEDNDAPGPEAFLEPGYGQDIERAERLLAAKPKPEKQVRAKAERKPRKKAFKLFDRIPYDGNGEKRFWCHACQNSFESADAEPEACAAGHRADDPELTSAPAPEAVEAEAAQAEAEPVAVEA